jgi:predicted histidine transporter YuiF (NhaC family)
MANKYGIVTFVMILCGIMLTVPVTTGFSKSPITVAVYQRSLPSEAGRLPRGLVLRSADCLP